MAKLVLDEPKTKPTLVLDEPEPDFGMIALPRKKLPGVWDFNRQLDALLGDPDKPLEDFLPLDVRYNFGRIIGMTEKPDETKDKMANSLYYSIQLNIPLGMSYNLQDAITKQKFGISLSSKETRNRLADEHYEQRRQYYRENFKPVSLFGNAFLQSLAGKPAMAIRGAKVYTPGDALGFDWFLTKTSEYLESLRSKEGMTDVEAAAAGKLWPIDKGASWYQIDPKLLPETINAWAATVGDQIPIMLMTLTGRAIGKVAGKPVGVGVGGLYALITGGPEPTDVVTVPIIAKVTEKVVEHLSGAAPLVAMEAGGFMDRANAIGLDNGIAEKYARPYGLGSGAIEYSQWLWNLKAFKILSPKVKMSIMKKVLIEIGGATWEGIEELSQQGLENFLIGKAIEEQKARTPEYDVEKPKTWAGGKRAFGIGLGVSLITRLPGHAYTTIRSRKLAEQIQEQTGATKEEADFAVEAMAEGGRLKQGVVEVIAEQKTKQEAKKAEKVVPIEEMPDEQLYEKFRATKFTEPEWKPLYEEVIRRQEAEKPPTEAIAALEKPVEARKLVKAVEEPVDTLSRWVRLNSEIDGTLKEMQKVSGQARETLRDKLRSLQAERSALDIGHKLRKMTPEEIAEDEEFHAIAQDILDAGPDKVNAALDILERRIGLLTKVSEGVLTQEEADTLTAKFVAAAKKRIPEPRRKQVPSREVAKPEAVESELLKRWAELNSIEKAKRMPQQIAELRKIEDELIKRHPPEVVEQDITDKTRRKVIKDTEEEIKSYDLYQSALQHIEEQQLAMPLKQYIVARTKDKIPGEIKDYIGKSAAKGYKGYLWKYLTTYEENPNAMGWDEALEQVGGRPGDIGEFIERLDQVVQLSKGKAAISQQALDIAIGQGDLYAEIISVKYEMLKKGFGATEINNAIREIAQKENIDLEMVEGYYVPVEETKYVRTKQEILKGLLRESQKVERKVQRPTLEEAAVRKATEIAHKTKETQYVYERTGKDAGLFAVSKKPPTEGAYKKIIPPEKGELKGRVEEGFAGFTPEELQRVKKLRQKIHAVAISKGLTKKALSELKLKHTGYRKLTGKVAGKKISLEQLQNLLKAVQKARPKRVGVITRKTEKKIQSLKENLKKKLQMTDEAFAEILQKEVHGKEPKYTSAKDFITETQGKDIIRRMHDEAEVQDIVLPRKNAIENNKAISEAYAKIKSTGEIKDPSRLRSMRFYIQRLGYKADAPLYDLYMSIININNQLQRSRDKIKEHIIDTSGYEDIAKSEESLKRISDYIASKSYQKNKPATPANITLQEEAIAKYLEKTLKQWRWKARLAKFFDVDRHYEDIPQYNQYKKEIHKAVDILDSQGVEALIEYLKTQEWGVIKSGYEPLESITLKIRPFVVPAKGMAKGHIKPRTQIEYMPQERNILQRFDSYLRQIDNLSVLRPKINAFVQLIEDNLDKFDNPQDARASVEVFLLNLKHINPSGNGLVEKVIRRLYGQALTVRVLGDPLKIIRNYPTQNLVFEQDKSTLFDPRNKPLTAEETEYFTTNIEQSNSLMREWAFVGEKPLPIPIAKELTEFIKKHTLYPWSDKKNRLMSFSAKINQVKRASETAANDVEKMMELAKFSDYEAAEQQMALGILALDGTDAMARYIARAHVENTHYLYDTKQRSPAEQTITGKLVLNLFLFRRASLEKLFRNMAKAASPTATLQQRIRATKVVSVLLVSGFVAGWLWRKLTGQRRQPYDYLSFLEIQPGGLAWGAIENASESFNNLLGAATGNARALAALAISLPYSADMMLPFYKQALDAIEATTGTNNLDRLAIRKIRELIDKEYKIRGDAYEIDRKWYEAIQRAIAGSGVDHKKEKKKKPRKVIE